MVFNLVRRRTGTALSRLAQHRAAPVALQQKRSFSSDEGHKEFHLVPHNEKEWRKLYLSAAGVLLFCSLLGRAAHGHPEVAADPPPDPNQSKTEAVLEKVGVGKKDKKH